MTLIPVDVDDDVVYVDSNRNFICRKVYGYLPAGGFKIRGVGADGEIAMTLKNTIVFLEIGTTWKEIKRMLDNDDKDPATWECPICCEIPERKVLSTCGTCNNELCMKCFILGFEKTRGTIQCPWCRELTTDKKLSDVDLAFICWQMRETHRIPHPV